MEITARVRQSSHPHQGIEQAKLARHLVLDVPLDGRLRRDAGDALCRPAVDFYELERADVEGDATCRKCLERATRYGVRVIPAVAPVKVARTAFDQGADGLLAEPTAGRYALRVCEAPRDVCNRGRCSTSSTRAAGSLDDVTAAGAAFRHAWAVDQHGRTTAITSPQQPTAADEQLDRAVAEEAAHFTRAARALDAVEYAEGAEAGVESLVDAEALYAARLVTEADATAGTWRGQWIGADPSDAALFHLPHPAEQGALFA
ncbi:hypothetical protein [Streptomyces sp. NPDC002104]